MKFMKEKKIDLAQEVVEIVQQLLQESGTEYPQRKIMLDASLQRNLGIDSFGRAELFQRIEKKFSIQLPDNLMAEAETLNDIVKAIPLASTGDRIEHPSEIQFHKLEESFINPSQAKTLLDVLLLYATGDPERPHIYLQDDEGHEEIITYIELFDNALRIAHALIKRGLKPGETVAIMQPTNPGFFYTFFGVLLANCIPVPIYPPFRPHQIEAYAKQEAKILKNAEVRLLVTFHQAENLSKLLRAFIPSLKEVTTVSALLKNEEKAPFLGAKEDDFALIQYTSGSTSAPKGVLLTHQNLLANIRAYGEAIAITYHDVTVSWAPLYHDLGLIGFWLGSLYHGIPLRLMSPMAFLNRPERWLWAIHYYRGTLSGGPNFAYELCVRKIEPAMIEGLDLSSWRMAANGAEAIQAKTLDRFTEKFSPYGFRAESHLPVYGLAESAVCVATSPLNRLPRIDRIERKAFEEKNAAIFTTDTKEQNSLEFVACGKPIPHHEVRIVDESQTVLAPRQIGQLQFKGPSSMQGYFGNPEATMAIYHDGWWDSGDLAYIADGEIFITGRKKDIIIKTGRNLYPAEIEELTAQVPQIRKGCVIAFATSDQVRGTEKLIVVAETREKKPSHPEEIIVAINEKILSALDVAPDQIILVPPQTIPKTSSGKLQRAACKTAYLTGKLIKSRNPLWWQISKIGLSGTGLKLTRWVKNLGKFIYTLYAFLMITITVIPVYCCLWIFPRHVMASICKVWARSIFVLIFCPISVEGEEYFSQKAPLIFAANHSSYVDAFVLLGILPAGTIFTGKKELNRNPIARHFIQKLQFITVDRTDLSKGFDDAKQMEKTLAEGSSIAIFPEGTFTYGTGLRPFKLGAFKVSAETNTSICPIAIKNTRYLLRGDERLAKPTHIKITVSAPIMPTGKNWQEVTNLKNKVRAQIAKECGEPSLDLITPR